MESIDKLTLYKDEQAVRGRLLGLTGEIEILHLACHGEYDQSDPLLSRLYLTDGPVYAYELLEIQAHPHIVVLSACETAVHTRLPGDEIFGLVRPFISRGAGAVIATHWKVADTSSAEFMKFFYADRNTLISDLPACLRQTQLKLLHSEQYTHPYYWAPYYLIGTHGLRSTSSTEEHAI